MITDVYRQSFSRNLGILTDAEQTRLANSTVAIAGLGGIGGNTLIQLARMGVGRFRLADFDAFDYVNINRQYGAAVDTVGKRKCDVLAAEVASINPAADVALFPDGFTDENAADLLSGANAAIDAIDFYAIDTHLKFHAATRRHGLYTLMGSPVGFSACLQIFAPDGMSLAEYCAITPEMSDLEKQLRYACGLVPELLHIGYFDVSTGGSNTDFLQKQGPSAAVACSLAAALVATETVLLLLERRPPRVIPFTMQFDPYTYRFACSYIRGGMGHFDPAPAMQKVEDKSSFVPQVFELLYRKKRSVRAPVNGAELYYKVEGEGDPVVLISPLGADSSFWARQTPALAERFRVVSFDNRGSGESTPCDDGCTTAMLAEDVVQLIEHLGLQRVHLVGLALGGLVAQLVAAQRPDLVRRLVLVSSYMHADAQLEELTSGWRDLARERGMDVLFDACVPFLFSPEYVADNRGELSKLKTFYRLTLVDPDSFTQQSLAGIRHDSTDIAGSISIPTLVIHGGADRVVEASQGAALAAAIPNADYLRFDDAPHFLIWEHAARFNGAVTEFLQQA